MGHVLNYTMGDVVTHFRRRHGWRVLRPMGYDSFGLPAENAAINEGGHPREITERNIVDIRAQMKRLGWAIDWDREVSTHDPDVLPLDAVALPEVLRGGPRVPEGGAGQLVPERPDGARERAGDQRPLRALRRRGRAAQDSTQWFFKITDYADELLTYELPPGGEWPERTMTIQRNWIGRSEGAEVDFRIAELDVDVPVFTTRPDTLFGATFFVLAPEHPLVERDPRALARRRRAARLRAPRAARSRRGARGGRGEDRRLHGLLRDEPGERRADPDLGRRLRADGLRHRRDHGRAGARRARRARSRRQFGLPIVAGDRRRRHARQLGAVQRAARRRGEAGDRRLARASAAAASRRSTTACATGASRGSATGAARSRSSTATTAARAGARGRAAGAAARRRGLPAEGAAAARERNEEWMHVAVPEVRQAGAARGRDDGHVRRLVVVLPALRRPAQRRRAVRPRGRRLLAARSTSTSAASTTRRGTSSTRASS